MAHGRLCGAEDHHCSGLLLSTKSIPSGKTGSQTSSKLRDDVSGSTGEPPPPPSFPSSPSSHRHTLSHTHSLTHNRGARTHEHSGEGQEKNRPFSFPTSFSNVCVCVLCVSTRFSSRGDHFLGGTCSALLRRLMRSARNFPGDLFFLFTLLENSSIEVRARGAAGWGERGTVFSPAPIKKRKLPGNRQTPTAAGVSGPLALNSP